jgi:hypothetical protein
MRILIQDPAGNGYFDGVAWKGEPEQAREFETVSQAEAFCREHDVTRALIVLKYNDAAQDIRFLFGAKDALVVSKPPTTKISSLS